MRRQGLEPRTRGLRVCCSANLIVSDNVVKCSDVLNCTVAHESRCRLIPVAAGSYRDIRANIPSAIEHQSLATGSSPIAGAQSWCCLQPSHLRERIVVVQFSHCWLLSVSGPCGRRCGRRCSRHSVSTRRTWCSNDQQPVEDLPAQGGRSSFAFGLFPPEEAPGEEPEHQ
jgi:hypothetical protein